MPARFFCKTGAFAGSSFEIGEEATVGRRTEEEITLASDVVSGRHARIFRDGEHYVLEDLGSSNGTRVDGVEVVTPVRLGGLHVVTFADQIDFIFQALPGDWTPPRPASNTELHTAVEEGFAPVAFPEMDGPADGEHTRFAEAFTPVPTLSDAEEPPSEAPRDEPPVPDDSEMRTQFGAAFVPMPDLAADTPMIEGPPDEPPAADTPPEDQDATVFRPAFVPESSTGPSFVLDVQRVGAAAERFVLGEGEHVIGRALECEVTVDDHSVSRRHAVLTVRDGAVTVRDLGSKNRTRLDGEAIDGEVTVPPGSVLRFGLQVEAALARA